MLGGKILLNQILPESSLASRMKVLVDLVGSAEKLARLSGMSARVIGKYVSGETDPSRERLIALAKAAEVNVLWLATGEGPMKKEEVPQGVVTPAEAWFWGEEIAKGVEKKQRGDTAPVQAPGPGEDFVQVPRFEIAASAGGGAVVHSEQIVDYMAFRAEWLKTSLGMSPGNAAVISVVGDSMEPYLADGDLILIDTGINRIENDSVYVLQTGGSLLVKRVQRKFDGTVIVKSDNESYEPEVFRGDSVEYLKVVGRMVRRLVR